jgi:hypothetical protein
LSNEVAGVVIAVLPHEIDVYAIVLSNKLLAGAVTAGIPDGEDIGALIQRPGQILDVKSPLHSFINRRPLWPTDYKVMEI